MSLHDFINAYIDCAIWSSTNEHGEPLDATYSRQDIDPATLHEIVEECTDFYTNNAEDCEAQGSDEQCGHDFWLTRNRHGAGFWDRGTGAVGERLTAQAHAYGTIDLYVGDDGKIYA